MEGLLTLETIDNAVLEVEKFYEKVSVDEKVAVKVKLGVEETLLRFRDKFGEKQEFALKLSSSFGKHRIVIEVHEQMFDPYAKSDDDEGASLAMRSALSSMGALPIWRYSRGTNIVSYITNKKTLPEWYNLILAIVLAIVFGLLLRQAPENVVSVISEDIFSPLLGAFMSLLSAIASPMIFFAIIWGIYSIGDASTFNVLGKKLALRYVIYTAIITVVLGLVAMLFFTFVKGESTGPSDFSDIYAMIIGIIPNNIFSPFLDGNTLQILFLGVTIGIAMIIIGEKTQNVALIAEQIYYLVQIIMNFISKLVPFFVFGNLLDLILSNQLAGAKASYKLLLVNLVSCILIILTYITIVTIKLQVRPTTFIKKFMPSFIIGLTTASSAAAFSDNLTTCIKEFGVKKNFANFGIPFGQVIYKPSVAILFFSMAIFCADVYKVPTSLTWFITAFALSIILCIATPPIPGGALASISVFFMQLGIPAEGLALVMALNVFFDFIETPTDILGGQTMLLLSADKFKLIDKNILRN